MKDIEGSSQFRDSYRGLLGRVLLAILISVVTLGIAVPWAITMLCRWIAARIQVSGRALSFEGRGKHLFGTWIIYYLTTIAGGALYKLVLHGQHYDMLFEVIGLIGLILLSVWVSRRFTRTIVSHIRMAGEKKGALSTFKSTYATYLGKGIVYSLRMLITLGIGLPWATAYYMSWWSSRTTIGGEALQYNAEKPSFLRSWIPYWIILAILQIACEILATMSVRHDFIYDFSFIASIAMLFVYPLVYNFVITQIVTRLSIKKSE